MGGDCSLTQIRIATVIICRVKERGRYQPMADIFVSYSRTDKAAVAPLVAALESQGWSVWWDPEITPGDEFDKLIGAELESARAVVVV